MFEPESRYANPANPYKYTIDDPSADGVAGVTGVAGEVWLGLRIPVDLPPDATDAHVHPRPGERPDAFSDRVWGNHPIIGAVASQLYWVILDVNKDTTPTTNPFTALDPAVSFRIPSGDRVAALLGYG